MRELGGVSSWTSGDGRVLTWSSGFGISPARISMQDLCFLRSRARGGRRIVISVLGRGVCLGRKALMAAEGEKYDA